MSCSSERGSVTRPQNDRPAPKPASFYPQLVQGMEAQQCRAPNGCVYRLPDVRALTSDPLNPFLTPTPSPSRAYDDVYFWSDESVAPVTRTTGTANVSTFYAQETGTRHLPGRGCRIPAPATARLPLPPGRPASPSDSCVPMYSSEDDGADGEAAEATRLSRFYSSLTGFRSLFWKNRTQPPADHLASLKESLFRVAAQYRVDLTPDGVREVIRKRERQELEDEVQMQAQIRKVNSIGFDD